MTNLNDAANAAMNANGLRQYSRQAEPVIAALTEREKGITATLLQAAQDNGIDRETATRVFQGAGLTMPDAAVGGVDAGTKATVDSLVAFARRHGFTG